LARIQTRIPLNQQKFFEDVSWEYMAERSGWNYRRAHLLDIPLDVIQESQAGGRLGGREVEAWQCARVAKNGVIDVESALPNDRSDQQEKKGSIHKS